MSKLQLFRYRLPLIAPIPSGDQRLTHRAGLLVRKTDGDHESWGDAAPLPGLSVETLSEVIDAARKQQWDRFASLQFAYASLALSPAQAPVAVSALLMGEMADLRNEIHRVAQLPHAAIKLKVARGGLIEEEIALVKTLLHALRPDQRLRLDANGRWTYEQALAFWQAVADNRVEYLEEPTADPADFERLWRAAGVRFALDESLRRPGALSDFPHAAALVIKPTLLGGPEQLRAFTSSTIPCVFSAAFESGIGIVNIARLANQLGTSHPVGLDTYRWLADDVLYPRLSLDQGRLDLPATWNIDYTRLEPLKS